MMRRLILLGIITLLLLVPLFAYSQCKVSHINGTINVNGINVTVTHNGDVDTISFCNNIFGPYWIGVHYAPFPFSCNGGGYKFIFTPPSSELFFNFGSLDGSSLDSEVVKLYVNGTHYSIPFLGSISSCQPMAILTSDGDITSAINGGASEGIKITGLIDSIIVIDSVIKGCPNGAIFSLALCDWPVSTNDYLKNEQRIKVYPNPINSEVNIEYDCSSEGEFAIYNNFGQQVYSCYLPKGKKMISKNLSELNNGLYLYCCRFEGYSDTIGKITVNK